MIQEKKRLSAGWGSGSNTSIPGYKCPHCKRDVSEAYDEGTGICPHKDCNGSIEKSAQARDKRS
jgi:hypothetical protein